METPLTGKNILLGVTGSIACYKAADLASRLSQAGALVDVVLTQSALQFITPLTFQSVTGRRAYVDADLWGRDGHVLHIELARRADLMIIAPASANTLARLAHGIADNLLTVAALAARCPLLVAPAMDGGMFTNPATQANLETLHHRSIRILGPGSGHLASGMVGIGRMLEPAELLGHIRLALGEGGLLAGRHVLVTAGGTQESIDPVRAITNRSSGKQGYALAQAALDLGASVTLISGPTSLVAPTGARCVDVISAQEMLQAVLTELPAADALLMAAAVADFRPSAPSNQKIKKENGIPQIELVRNPDILAAVAEVRQDQGVPEIVVGFAAESQDLLTNAAHKLKSKRLDLIVANDISIPDAGFNVDTNRVVILDAEGTEERLPLLSKSEVAEIVVHRVGQRLRARSLVHICPQSDWEKAMQEGEYRPETLESEGFIHCSTPQQVLATANRYFTGLNDLVLLWIAPRLLKAEVRWESAGTEVFPHIYGALNLEAVLSIENFRPDQDGIFRTLRLM